MPFHWIINSREKLVEIQAEGPIALADCVQIAEVLKGARCLPYRKLLDARQVRLEMSHEEVMQVVVMARGFHERGPVGPMAIVTTKDRVVQSTQILGAFAAADRPLKLFTGERQARKWLASLP
jgi:hypothetical protein